MTRFAVRFAACAALAPLAVAPLAFPPASAQFVREQVGTLNCDIAAGIGFIIGSRKEVNCLFTPAFAGPSEAYVGSISKFGLDVGVTSGGQMVWAVHTQTTLRRGALAGVYTGATGEATVIAGLGANVLLGGSDRSVALQPISLTAQGGLNLAVGVVGLELIPAR